jgi:predicted transcriptional regulator
LPVDIVYSVYMSPMVRINDETAEWLKDLARASGLSQTVLIAMALEAFRQDGEAVSELVRKHVAEIEKVKL